ncbi:MAG: hypothetical protein Kow0098_07910 [Ignavibacteriaceae bacterium]
MTKSNKLIIPGIIAFLFLSLYSCKEDTIEPVLYGSISGTVYDAVTLEPLEGVNITTSPPTNSIATNTTGNFLIEEIPIGNYNITASKNGYEKQSVSVSVKEDQITEAVIYLEETILSNTPPDKPSEPSPANNSTDMPVELNLAWVAVDQDSDALFFDVFLFESSSPVNEKIAEDITDTSVFVSNLLYNTTYFWQVIAKDSSGASTAGETWSFKTLPFPDLPIVFTSGRDGNYEIYSTDTSSSVIRLTFNSFIDLYPRISPNRQKIAFTSDAEINSNIYIMNRDGSSQYKVTSVPVEGYHNQGIGFCWSADGGYLYYSHYEKLYKIDQLGANLQQIATAPADRHFREVDCSPLGDKLVVVTIGSEIYDNEIYIMNTDGTDMSLLVDNRPGIIESPAFSIDGQSIIFTQDLSGFESPTGRQLDAHIIHKNLISLTETDISVEKPSGTNDLHPVYSPNGSVIIYENVSNDGLSEPSIWIMDSDGDNRNLLAENGKFPHWR